MLPDRVSNPGLLTYKSDALPIALRGPALKIDMSLVTTGHCDLNAKEKINFDLYKLDYGQKQYSISLLTGPAKHFFWR